MATNGDIISNGDYNTIRNKIIDVIGAGSGNFGYGQNVQSASVVPTERITKEQWDNLRFDIINARIHQTGEIPSIVQIQTTDPIRYGASSPNYQYDTLAGLSRNERFRLGTGQFIISSATSRSTSVTWSSFQTITLVVTFSTSQSARYFFNSGGKIRFTSTRTGGSQTQQNQSWTNILSSAGVLEFGATTPTIGFYNLTSSDQICFNYSSTSSYASNNYKISARCNITNNSGGGATVVYFTISYNDLYVDTQPETPPGDSVDGILTLTVEQVKAAGTLLPTGSFSIIDPGYSLSSFSGS
jgi:hypothetical protein